MTAQVLDIETICPKCDAEFTVTYISHEAEAAEARAAQLEAERDAAIDSADYYRHTYLGMQTQIDTLTAERDAARRELQRIKQILAVGRKVGEDKEQAYEDAEEIADIALNGGSA